MTRSQKTLDLKDKKKLMAAVIVVGTVLGAFAYLNFFNEESGSRTVTGKLFNGKLSREFEFSEGDYITYQQSSEAFGAIASQPIILELTEISENGYTVELIDTFREGENWEKLSLHDHIFVRAGYHGENDALFFPEVAGEWEFTGEENDGISIYKNENLTVWVDKITGIPIKATVLVENRPSSPFDFYKHITVVEETSDRNNTNIDNLKESIEELHEC